MPKKHYKFLPNERFGIMMNIVASGDCDGPEDADIFKGILKNGEGTIENRAPLYERG